MTALHANPEESPAVTQTAASSDAIPAEPLDPARPAVHLLVQDRYEIGALLGRGGMAEVYEAYDRQLLRPLALKFLHLDNPQTTERLLREARSQARIDHPHICKVFDVGSLDGRPFIAMQRVAGGSLRALAGSLSVTQVVGIVQRCASAVQAAHRLGVVHRDLKPANILVELDPDGSVHPYLADFGLADFGLAENSGRSAQGGGPAAGTAAYMAPEQVRGDSVGDRRSDIYALGATLYALLTGEPPFPAATRQATWQRVLHDAAPALASAPALKTVDPLLLADLDAIVACCLQKDPRGRYASAQDLARDLGRALVGEPVHAAGGRWLYRLRHHLRRQRRLWLAALVTGLVVTSVAAWGLHGYLTRRELARTAARFGGESHQAELNMRMARLLPAHDVRPDRAATRQRLQALEQTLPTLRGITQGLACVALGRGLIALEEWDLAASYLRTAWSQGLQDAETAAALGYALAMLAEQAQRDATRITDAGERAAEQRRIDQTLHTPSLQYLRQAGDRHSYPWLPTLLALRAGRIDDALAAANHATQKDPGLFEAHLFAAKAQLQRALQHEQAGRLVDAETALRHALSILDQVVATARSHGSAHAERCGAWVLAVGLAFSAEPREAQRRYEAAKSACALAEQIDPDNEVQQSSQALLHARWADRLAEHGEDPQAAADRAIAIAERSVGQARHPEYALSILGSAWGTKARADIRKGRDPQPSFARSIDALSQALAHRPRDVKLHRSLAQTWTDLAQHQRTQRTDPRAALREAMSHLRAALALDGNAYSTHNDLAVALQSQAEYELEQGLPAQAALHAGIAHARQAVSGGAGDPYPAATLSDLLTLHAQQRGPVDATASTAAREAEQQALRVIALDPSWYYGYLAQGRALSLQAEWSTGPSAPPLWRRAREALLAAQQRNREEPAIRSALVKLEATAPRACAAHLRCAKIAR